MKKTFLAILMGVAIISGSVALPVHTETVSAASIGGNINWGSSNTILPTDVTTAKTGCTFLGIKGSYIADMQNALNRINEIRKEACDERIRDPRNEYRYLTPSDYVPIKWSSDLEYIARIRAAEASIYMAHTRLNEYDCFSIKSPNGIQSYGEVLAWNSTGKFIPGIEQWYGEKADWVGKTGGETGHYTQMIDPDNTYVGLATFINPNGIPTTTAGEYSFQKNLDESAGPAIANCIQTVEVKTDKITTGITALKNSLAANSSVQAAFKIAIHGYKAEPLGTVSWKSSDIKSATVSGTGMVTGIHEGSADITASYGSYTVTKNIKVTGHPNTEVRNAKNATCSAEGYTGDAICKDCGLMAEKGTIIPKKAHSWDSGIITVQPTCTGTGVKTFTCTVCKTTKTETLKENGHKAVTDAAVAETCEKAGKTAGSHCSVCNTILVAQQTVEATGHSWNAGVVTKSATCEEAGVKTYTCTSCQKTRTEEMAALGHIKVTDPAVKAKCETAGKTEGTHCSRCDKILVEQETIKALDHKVVTSPAVKPTCTKAGKTEASHCTVCGKVLKKRTVVKAAGHKFGQWKTVSKATVLAPEKQSRTCSACKKSEERTIGKKRKATMKLNASSVVLKVKQKTTVLKVTGLAKEDSVVSWNMVDENIAKVSGKANGTCTITAGNAVGRTYLIIGLKSGIKKSVIISVQRYAVETRRISGIAKTMTLKRNGKVTLKPVLTPLTSADKITYKSSNAAVAAVNAKGQVTAKKKGTAVITVKSGKKSVTCKVTVR